MSFKETNCVSFFYVTAYNLVMFSVFIKEAAYVSQLPPPSNFFFIAVYLVADLCLRTDMLLTPTFALNLAILLIATGLEIVVFVK